MAKENEAEQKQKELELKIKNLDRFPGSLVEYNDFKGQKYAIMDTGRPAKFVLDDCMDFEVLSKLVEQGCEALIRYDPHGVLYNGMGIRQYGVPVKPIKQK